jgi:hypothetical protein
MRTRHSRPCPLWAKAVQQIRSARPLARRHVVALDETVHAGRTRSASTHSSQQPARAGPYFEVRERPGPLVTKIDTEDVILRLQFLL